VPVETVGQVSLSRCLRGVDRREASWGLCAVPV